MSFQVTGRSTVSEAAMRRRTAMRGPGALPAVRGALDFMPGISAPEYGLFSPLALQKDVVRLRRLYHEAGLARAHVDYEVQLDTASNRVDVRFLIDEGEPLRIGELTVLLPDSVNGAWPPEELADAWARHEERIREASGRRYSLEERTRVENQTTAWLRNHGYPWGRAAVATADTTELDVAVRLGLAPGTRARVDSLVIEGRRRLAHSTVRREVPVREGEWYNHSKVSNGEREVFELDIVRRALSDVPDEQSRDSTVLVRYRIEEGNPRIIWGRAGYRTSAGASGEAHWVHRDFLGEARTFTASAVAETGWGAFDDIRSRRAGLSVAFRQPFQWHRRVSLTVSPFGRFRDDFRDQSVEFGVETGLLYQIDALKHLSVRTEVSRRRVDDVIQLSPVRSRVLDGDSAYVPEFVTTSFKLVGSYGDVDNRLSPTSGWLVRPNVELSGPSGISDVQYVRGAVEALAALPLGRRYGLFFRASAGRLVPYGQSDPPFGQDRTRSLAGLRGVMFTTGGTGDVRGWGRELLGSKVPDITVESDGSVTADRYLPAGGLARLSGHVELMLPFPGFAAPHRTFVFTDAGRLWSPGGAFDPADPELVSERWQYSTGGGIELGTLIGPVRIGLGYKINPTVVDLLDAAAVAQALVNGVPLSTLEPSAWRRWRLHLSIGRTL